MTCFIAFFVSKGHEFQMKGAVVGFAAKPSPAILDTGHFLRDLVCVLILGVFQVGCLGPTYEKVGAMTPNAADITFEQYELVTCPAQRQTVLTGFFLGGAIAELAVVNVNENNERRVRIYTFNQGAWVPRFDTKLRPAVLFVDVARIGGRDRLITYEPGRLNWFDPASATEHALVKVATHYNATDEDEIPQLDITRDVNRDGRDDLLVPDVDGFWVSIQMSDGSFTDAVKLGPPEPHLDEAGLDDSGSIDSRSYGEVGGTAFTLPLYLSRVHEMDYDQDGRNDLVFWNEDHFEVHRQEDDGLFAPVAKTFRSDVAFDSDDLFSLAAGAMQGKVLHSLADLNDDGVADLVLFSLQGKKISKKRSTYEVHFGSPTSAGGTVFTSDVDLAFRANNRKQLRKDRAYRSNDRIQFRMDRHDFNADGQVDLMFTSIDPYFLKGSLWKSIKGFMGDDVLLGIEFYLMDAGRYRSIPDTIRIAGLDGIPSHREPGSVPLEIVLRGATHERRRTQTIWPGAFNSTLLIGDVTGEGHLDLITGPHPYHLSLALGVSGPELFAQRHQDIAVDVPNDEEYVWLVDLNRDGKQDILMHQPFMRRDGHGAPQKVPGTEPQRVTMLIAQ